MNETSRPAVVVPQLNLVKAVKQQEKQVLAREIIERDKMAKVGGPGCPIGILHQKRGTTKQEYNRNNLQTLKTVGDEGILYMNEIEKAVVHNNNTVKNQTKANGGTGSKNAFNNFRQS